jgi:hypothetical protein
MPDLHFPDRQPPQSDAAVSMIALFNALFFLGETIHPEADGALLVRNVLGVAFSPLPSSTDADNTADPRAADIEQAIGSETPATRTQALRLLSALAPILRRLHSTIAAVKSDLLDDDVTHAEVEVLAEGWLRVTVHGEEVGRVPFDPSRGDAKAQEIAEHILQEYARLHVLGAVVPVDTPLPDDPGRRPNGANGERRRGIIADPADVAAPR